MTGAATVPSEGLTVAAAVLTTGAVVDGSEAGDVAAGVVVPVGAGAGLSAGGGAVGAEESGAEAFVPVGASAADCEVLVPLAVTGASSARAVASVTRAAPTHSPAPRNATASVRRTQDRGEDDGCWPPSTAPVPGTGRTLGTGPSQHHRVVSGSRQFRVSLAFTQVSDHCV
jgi:hypothetical protein